MTVYLSTDIRPIIAIAALLFALLSIDLVESRVLLPKRGRILRHGRVGE